MAYFWLEQRTSGNYPHDYREAWRPLRPQLQLLSEIQLSMLDTYYRRNFGGLMSAFLDFGQGVLWDPRRPDPYRVHIMNGDPTPGYHVWHAYIRAMDLLNVDADRWRSIERLVGAAWHVQSLAKPAYNAPNTPLEPIVVADVKRLWLRRSTEEIDEAFESNPYPAGVS
ncbi:hypothetical protein [Salinispora sp. H7-4]|uniref:hypothetical protein n=1 Tax=Salinispora sp. H7-4 TaxID=2748321 RepID=UPI0015D3617C|nr:hypothetical protein [Salinispora sp. H7-4]NYT96201.1 hypothetical protein [Salinispora sp. H7-4]